MKEITIKNRNKTDVTDEALYALGQESFEAWKEQGLDAPWMHQTFAEFQESIRRVSMFVAQDAETGELLGMHSFRAYRRQGWCYGFRLAVAPHLEPIPLLWSASSWSHLSSSQSL